MPFLLTILAWILTILAVLLVTLWFYARWNYGVLERLGIPVVKPFLCLGSNYDEAHVLNHERDLARQKELGMVYGVYDGRTPHIYISDPKIIRRITTVDFEHFRNHMKPTIPGPALVSSLLDFLDDEQWKTVRQALTPIFTGAKIKQLGEIVKDLSEEYAESLAGKADADGRINNIEFRETSAPMIIEILAKAFCGIEIPNAKDANNEFITKMKASLMHDIPKEDWTWQIAKVLPFMMTLLKKLLVDEGAMKFFTDVFNNVAENRAKSGGEAIDALNTLVEMLKKCETDPKYKELKINKFIVVAQAWEFFIAGYFGLRDNFTFLMYEAASNPEIQEKMYLEIQAALEKTNGKFTAETYKDLPYVTACLLETTRMYSTFVRPDRICNKNWEYEGLRIPKGMTVIFPIYAVHFNPEFYPNPTKFNPEHFLGANKESRDPYAYLPFGQGPRACIGQRFAMEMLKIMVCSFLRKFEIKKRKDTVLKPKVGVAMLITHESIHLDVMRR